jgi:hypothetical protein
MRPIPVSTLVILWLLVSSTWGYAMGRPARKVHWMNSTPSTGRQLAVAQPRPMEKPPSWEFKGWGQTREDAEENALKRARERILEYLAASKQPLQWAPSLAYIKKHMVKELRPEPSQNFGDGVGELQGMRLVIEFSPKDWQYILSEDRRVRSEFRMLVVGKALVGLVAFLGVVAGYLRLEEMTKGYYTAWLRLAAIAFITAVGAGILLIS